MGLFTKKLSFAHKYAEMSQNPNVTHTDEWIRNDAWVVFFPTIAMVTKTPHVWKTTPECPSDSSCPCLYFLLVRKAGRKAKSEDSCCCRCPRHFLSFQLFPWENPRGRGLSAQQWSPNVYLTDLRIQSSWDHLKRKKKKIARSEHTFREWSQTFKGQKLPLYCISLSNSSIVKNQCKTTSRGILLAFKLAYLPWNQCSKTMFPFSPFPTVLFSLPWDEFFSLLFFI